MAFVLTSLAFQEGTPIPAAFTCDGADKSPALAWQGAPPATRFYAMVMDDPDAPKGTWTHWTWWDLPSSVTQLAEDALPSRLGGVEGTTSAHSTGYHGPCPPSGRHRYVFTLHATSDKLGLPPGAPAAVVHTALMSKSIGSARLTGTYQKASP